jgi:hypothetical protein
MADEKELYFAHTLDIVWIIALWHYIHGGDPSPDPATAQTTELMARALVGYMSSTGGKTETAENVIEKLGKLGIKMVTKSEGKQTEIKSTKEFYDRMKGGGNRIIPCGVVDGHQVCSPIWFQPIEIHVPHGPR